MITLKSTKILFMTLMVTTVVFLLKSDFYQKADNQLRQLVTDQEMNDICNAAFGNKYTDIALNYTKLFEEKSQDLANILSPSKTDDYQKIIDYIKDSSNTDGLVEYVWKRASPYIVFIAFAVISLITWFVLCICCCKPCLCCKKSKGDGCCKTLTVIFLILAYAGIIIGCIIGFIYSTKFVEAINGSTCAFLVFYKTAVSGEDPAQVPRWLGINNVANILDSTLTAVDTITSNSQTAFKPSDSDTTDLNDFKNSLTNSYNTYSGSKLNNPNPAPSKAGGVTQIQPLYITKYGDYLKDGTTLNSIYVEYDTKIRVTFDYRKSAQDATTEITNNAGEVKQKLQEIKTNVNNFINPFNKLSEDVIGSWIDVQNQINDIGIVAFLILFAILIGMSIFTIFALFCYGSCCKWQGCRFILHLIWWLFSLIMILTFLLGGIFGILGLIGADGTPVIQWIFGTENLTSKNPAIFGAGDTSLYLDTCINLDGDLPNRNFKINQSSVTQLDTLYTSALSLTDSQKALKANSNSVAITKINSEYTSLQTDINSTTDSSLGNNSISSILSELRGWSDAGQKKYQSNCSPASYDVWVDDKANCPSSYTQESAIGSQSCLIIPGYTQITASSRYSSQTGCSVSGSTDFTSVTNAVGSYVGSLNVYITDNKNLLNNLITNNNQINQKFVAIANRVLEFLDRMQGVIDPLIKIFNSIVGKNGLFSIINCAFMKKGMNNIYSELKNDLSHNAFSLGAIIIAVSFLEYLSVIFLFILINKFKKDDKEQSSYVIVEHKA